MINIRYIVLITIFSSSLFGAGGFEESDFIWRSINFLIFIAILYFLVFDKIKSIFVARRDEIADRLQEVQDKLKESKMAKEAAQKRLGEAKDRANDIVATAKKEAFMLSQKIDEQSNLDIKNLIAHHESAIEFEKKKMQKEVLSEILDELFKGDVLNLSKSDYVDILMKKVS